MGSRIKAIIAIPLLAAAAIFAPSAARIKTRPAEDTQQEVVEKVSKLAVKLLFQRYDINSSGKLDQAEVSTLLADADVGNWITRNGWVSGVMDALDKDKDGQISLVEMEQAL